MQSCGPKTSCEPSLMCQKQAGLPSWFDGRHPLYLTGDGKLVDEDGDILDRNTFIQMREELGARILTNSRGKVAHALGFSGGWCRRHRASR